MNPAHPRISPAAPAPALDVRGLQRRICLLRRQDQIAAAEQLRLTQLEPACAALQEAGTMTADRLEQMFVEEENRVDDMLLLADLLAPILLARLAVPAPPAAPPPAARPPPASPPRPAPGDIAGFIDLMLAQQTPVRR